MDNCPNCGLDLNGGLIWDHFYSEFQTKGYWLDADGHYTDERRILSQEEAAEAADEVAQAYGANRMVGRWRKEIGLSSWDEDRVTRWQCPDCKHEWPR